MSAVGRRYAKAVFALAQEQNQVEAVGEQLTSAAQVIQTPAVLKIVASPMAAAARRRAVVQAIDQQSALRPLVRTVMLMLADRRRLQELPAIARQYGTLQDQALGRVRIRVGSAAPLSDAEREAIVRAFEKLSGKKVMARVDVDESLLGGVAVEAEGKVYDGSLRRQLELLGRQIAQPAHHS